MHGCFRTSPRERNAEATLSLLSFVPHHADESFFLLGLQEPSDRTPKTQRPVCNSFARQLRKQRPSKNSDLDSAE